MELRMNFLSNMNDPKENLLHIINFTENATYNAESKINFNEFIIAKKIRDETRIVTFSTDKEILVENDKQNIHGYKFQRMWATYGQNHEGVCLVVDYEKFKSENIKLIKECEIIDCKVKYGNFSFQVIPVPTYGMSSENHKKHKSKCLCEFWSDLKTNKEFIKKRFFTKNIDWDGESEYRFLSFNNEIDEIVLSIKESLSKLILGINFSKYFLPSLIELVPKEKIYTTDLDPSNGNFIINQLPNNSVNLKNKNHE